MFGRKRYVYYESSLDEETLTRVAELSGGLFFRATDSEALKRIYERISEMEKTEIETQMYVRYSEVGPLLSLIALLFLLPEILLSQTILFRLVE
jgi:Ca-activated chloride channel family protein